jgi:hypothetical protein
MLWQRELEPLLQSSADKNQLPFRTEILSLFLARPGNPITPAQDENLWLHIICS